MDSVHFNLFLLVDINVNNHLIFVRWIVLLRDNHFCILKAFIVKITFDQCLCTVNGIRSDLHTFYHTQFAFKVCTF